MSNNTDTVSTLKELQQILQRARTLHGNLSDQLVHTLGLDPTDVKARYGHFSEADGSTAQRRLRHRHPDPMMLPVTSIEKRKMRLLLRALRTSTSTDIMTTDNNTTRRKSSRNNQKNAAGEDGDEDEEEDDEEGEEEEEEEEDEMPNAVTTTDLRGTSRHSFALFEKLVLKSTDVADLTSSSSDDDDYDSSDEDEDDEEEEEEEEGESQSSEQQASTSTRNNNNNNNTKSVEVQTQETSLQTIKLSERLLSGNSEGSQGGLRSRRFPHWIPQPPSSSSLAAHLKSINSMNSVSNRTNFSASSSSGFGGNGIDSSSSSSSLSRQTVFAGQPYIAMVFRPQSMKMLQLAAANSNNNQDGDGSNNSNMVGDEEGPGGWTPTFFPVEVQFIPRNQQQQQQQGAGATNTAGLNKTSNNSNNQQQQQSSSAAGGTGGGSGNNVANNASSSNVDQEGGARLVIRRIPVTRDGQRFALSRADAAGAVITDVGCAALRSVTVGQTSRYFLRGRMVLQKKSNWAKNWAWKVPPTMLANNNNNSNSSSEQQQQQRKIPSSIDFTSIPSMAQMSDRSVALSFVDATVLNFPAKTTDTEEDTALQAAATRNLNNDQHNNNADNNNNAGPQPTHINTNPPNFVPTAGAELALVFPSHAEFNTFLAESMHWCADYSAFRYGRPADFHSSDVLKNFSPSVRDTWQSLDSEELTFCEEFHIPPSVYLTAKRRVTASADPTKSMTSVDSLLCEEDLSVICDVDYLQLSAMIRFLQARGFVKLHSVYHIKKAF